METTRTRGIFELRASLQDAKNQLGAARRDARRERAAHEMMLATLRLKLMRILEADPSDATEYKKTLSALLDETTLVLDLKIAERKRAQTNTKKL